MPEIQWLDLPPQLRQHLYPFALEDWRRHSPDVPEGSWYNDFGSFNLCGEGRYPTTFLLRGQAAHGQEIE